MPEAVTVYVKVVSASRLKVTSCPEVTTWSVGRSLSEYVNPVGSVSTTEP